MVREDKCVKFFDKKGQLKVKFEGMQMKACAFASQNYVMFTMAETTKSKPIRISDEQDDFEPRIFDDDNSSGLYILNKKMNKWVRLATTVVGANKHIDVNRFT